METHATVHVIVGSLDMKICIYGAGAIGGYLGVELARVPGLEVSLIARGAHLSAMRENGLKLLIEGEERTLRPMATDDSADGH